MKLRLVGQLLALLGFFVLASCERSQAGPGSDPVYDRVIEKGVLRAGYIAYPPSFIIDPNTRRFSGISHDVLEAAAGSLGLRVDYAEEVSWGTMIEAINSGRIDVMATGIWPNASRGKHAGFSSPIFYSPVAAYVRVDDSRFDGNIARANDPAIRISVIAGEMAEQIATTDFPRARRVSLPQQAQVSQLLLEVQNARTDITFVEPAVAREYLRANPNRLRVVSGIEPLRTFPTTFMTSNGSPRLLNMLNVAVDELVRNGRVDQIVARYEQDPGMIIRVRRTYP
jgi:polar amino acid transport system substrate-binding protein